MWIVLEGVDGAGKTTLAADLEREFAGTGSVKMTHHGPPLRHPLEEYVLGYDPYVPGRHDLITDRLHWGELIYGPLYRGETRLGAAGLRYVNMYLQSRGAIVVLVTAPLDIIRERLLDRGEDYLKAEDVARVWRAYEHMFAARESLEGPFTLKVRSGSDSIGRVPTILAQAAKYDRDTHVMYEVTNGRYLGSPRPWLVLVGDETSPRHLRGERPRYLTPFVPYADGCGRYLMDALPTELLSRIAIVNGHEVNLRRLREVTPDARYVALGRNAEAALKQADIEHRAVTHPQYARRFHHAEIDTYRREIARAANGF